MIDSVAVNLPKADELLVAQSEVGSRSGAKRLVAGAYALVVFEVTADESLV